MKKQKRGCVIIHDTPSFVLVEYVSYRELDRIGRTETCQIGISLVQDVLPFFWKLNAFVFESYFNNCMLFTLL